jgi:hypothetical protein
MINMAAYDPNVRIDSKPICPIGTSEVTLVYVEEGLKTSQRGNEYIPLRFERAGYNSIFYNLVLNSNPVVLGKLVNLLSSFGVKLEMREYASSEILQTVKTLRNKKVEVEVIHETYTKDGKDITKASISVFKPAKSSDVSSAKAAAEAVTDFIDSY